MEETNNVFDESNLAVSNWVKFTVFGDNIHGTLIRVNTMNSRLNPGKVQYVYEVKADGGEFHDAKNKVVIEPAVKINAGEHWLFGGTAFTPGRESEESGYLDKQLKNVKIGQKIGLKYTEDIPAKKPGMNDAKVKKLFLPKNRDGSYIMDEEFLKERNDVMPAL